MSPHPTIQRSDTKEIKENNILCTIYRTWLFQYPISENEDNFELGKKFKIFRKYLVYATYMFKGSKNINIVVSLVPSQ